MTKSNQERGQSSQYECPENPGMAALAYKPMVLAMVSRYVYDPGERKDACQDAMVALMEAARDFDPDRGVYFPVYAKRCVFYTLMARNRKRPRACLDLDAPFGEGPEAGTLGDTLADERVDLPRELEEELQHEQLRRAIGELSEGQRRVILGRYYNEESVKALAHRLGISPKTVENHHTRAVKNLRCAMGVG